MHELAITENILRTALAAGKEAGAKKITEIKLVIGKLNGFVPDCVQEYFDVLSENTMAEGAKLNFDIIETKITCMECGLSTNIKGMRLVCEKCGSHKVEIVSGRELYIDSIEIEEN